MTENEALKSGKALYKNITLKGNNVIPVAKYIEFVKMANEALEEIQQYRAIGTIEECKNNKVLADKRYEHFFDGMEQLEKYKAIGTVEEFKRAKEMEAVYGQVKWERDVAISQLEEIGVGLGQKMDEFKALNGCDMYAD